jgi:tRNA-2-methylthio-N6-dimethylallyladenosine synthase
MEEIVGEVERLAKNGTREFNLIAQDLSYYGKDLYGDFRLPELVEALAAIEGVKWIRLHYTYPNNFPLRTLDIMRDNPKVCKYLDIPLQHINDNVLDKMKRGHSRAETLALLKKFREIVPDITLRTTLLVGFPGETEEDFEGTLDMARKVRYDSAFTFIYSPREGTPAARFTDQIPDEVTHRRFDRLVDVMNEISLEKNLAYKGGIYEVLVEGVSKNEDDTFAGRTDGFKLVNFTSDKKPEDIIGTMVRVEITESKTFSLEGREVL